MWRTVSARSRFGVDVDMAPKAPFIGRDFESLRSRTPTKGLSGKLRFSVRAAPSACYRGFVAVKQDTVLAK